MNHLPFVIDILV